MRSMKSVAKFGLLAALSVPLSGWSHSESLNKDGCHQGKRHADYHCHEGPLKDRRYKSQEEAAKALILEAITPAKQSSAGEPEENRDPS